MNTVLARTKALELLDLGPNPARDKASFGWNIGPSQGPNHSTEPGLHKLNRERSTADPQPNRSATMKLVPKEPPGRSTRKARGFAPDMRELRAQGYTFEAIREALAAAGVHVSKATVQREVARLDKGSAPAVAASSGDWSGHELRSAKPMTGTPELRTPPLASPDNPAEADPRSGKEVAEAFTSSRITNPLVRARFNEKETP